MTSFDLRRIVAEELARAERSLDAFAVATDRTAFDPVIPGFAVRLRASGRRTYVVQTKIAGRMRTVTIGRAEIIPEGVARDVARRIVLRVDVGLDPAEHRHKVRHAPVYEAFLEQYWRGSSPNWKPSTQKAALHYRRNISGFIDHARKVCAVNGGTGRTVMFDERHPALPETQGRNLFATVAMVDAAPHLLPLPDLSSLEARAELAPTPAQQASHRADLELAREWWRADLRWLRSELEPLLMPAVFHLDGRSCTLLSDSVAWSILSPIVDMPESYCARSRGNPVSVPFRMVDEARQRAAETFALRSSAWCSAESGRLRPAIEERIGQIEVELDDLLAVREADVEKQSAGPAPLGEQARTGRIAAAQRAVRMIEEAGQARLEWLRAIAANPEPLAASILGEVLFRPVSASAG